MNIFPAAGDKILPFAGFFLSLIKFILQKLPKFTSSLYFLFLVLTIASCGRNSESQKKAVAGNQPSLFTLLSASETGVDFNNVLTENLNTNVLMYEYFYNGGGAAVGDLNNDGLEDIYFTGNMTSNRLYLNKGNMQFEDITLPAGVGGREGPWKTGVTMADVDGDGLLDIYVCYSGNLPPEKRANELFINQGVDARGIPHFIEQATEYGLADLGASTQAVFFDYDKDGDLDMFLLNHNTRSLAILDETGTLDLLQKSDPMSGVRLFRNEGNTFRDVTRATGLNSSPLSYGLGVSICDINGDGWPDIYICNDYAVPDYLYINNRNGTFSDKIQSYLGHTSHFSMGNDIADINNDGLPDIFTLDMLPEDNHRQKLLFAPDNYEKFDLNIRSGFYYQYMRNMLHVNNGNGTFSEIGQLAGVSNTDWSWAPLFADYDNDGWKDLFVTNGYLRDFTNMDFIKYMGGFLQNKNLKRQDILHLVQQIPSSDLKNYIFRNNGDLTFSDKREEWGLSHFSNSNGAVYADLDNDGDLDLIVNNINQPAFIYQNQSELKDHHYLKLKLVGNGKNTQGIGARVTLHNKGKMQYAEQMPTRGFQSSVSPVLHFGLGSEKTIDTLQVIWSGGKKQTFLNVKSDQFLIVKESDAVSEHLPVNAEAPLFVEVKSPLTYSDAVNTLNDFKRQPLMVNPLSFNGPCLVKGDVNNDGREDIYIGGAGGQSGKLFIQQKNGQFIQKPQVVFEADKQYDDADAVFLDANRDGFMDLYVCSGGYANYLADDPLLQDRLYLNDGKGNFIRAIDALPSMPGSKSCVRLTDFNGDGYPDLFVGGRVIPGRYPETPQSYILINDGKGRFKDMTDHISTGLRKIGMVSDAAWIDLNNDGKDDLVLVGEWMPVTVMINNRGKLENKTAAYFGKEYRGWWNSLLVEDLNGDGKPDLLIGNLGLNSQCRASEAEPAEMYYKDFDENGAIDPILCFYIQGRSYPYVTRDELLDQISIMRARFPDYKSYADATLNDIFTAEELKGAGYLKANYLKTALFLNTGQGFREASLPLSAQFAPVYALAALDYDEDGNKDILLCGNINRGRLRFGKYDANYGLLFKGDGRGGFTYVPQQKSGFKLKGDVRTVLQLDKKLLFGINQGDVKAYQLKKNKVNNAASH